MASRRRSATTTRAKGRGTPSSEVKDTFRSLHRREGVVGVIATTADGAVIKSTLEVTEETNRYALLAAGLCREANNSGTGKQPSFFKMKAGDREVLITPSRKYTLIVVTKLPNPSTQATQ